MLKRSIRIRWSYVAFGCAMLAVGVWCAPTAWGCPNCKDGLRDHAGNLELGFALSIGVMLGTPLALAAGWGMALVRILRNADAGNGHPRGH